MKDKMISAGEIGYDGSLVHSIEKMIGDIKSGDVYKIYFEQLSIEPPYFLDVEREYSSDLRLKLKIETSKLQTLDIYSKLPGYLKKLEGDLCDYAFIQTRPADNTDLSYYNHTKYIPSSDLFGVFFCIPEDKRRLFYAVAPDKNQRDKLEEYCDEAEEQGFYIGERDDKCILPHHTPLKFVRNESELIDEIGKYGDIQLYTISNETDKSRLWLKINKYNERDHIELNVSAPKGGSQEGPDLLSSDYLGDLLEVLNVEINPQAEMNIEKPGILRQTTNRMKRIIS